MEIDEEIGYKQGQGEDLSMMGMLYHDTGDFDQAEIFHRASLAISRELGYLQGEVMDLSNLATVLRVKGESTEALQVQNQALALIELLSNFDLEWVVRSGRAAIYEALGEARQAMADYETAIEKIESIRTSLPEEIHRIGMMGSDQMYVYRRLVLLIHGHFRNPSKMLSVVEHARARALLDQLSVSEVNIANIVTPEILEEEDQLLKRLRGVFGEQGQVGLTIEERRQLAEAARVLQSKLNKILEQIELEDPDYATLRRGRPVRLNEIRWILNLP